MFLNLDDAIEIVMTLASENVLEEREALQDAEVLMPVREQQLEAIAVVQNFFADQKHPRC